MQSVLGPTTTTFTQEDINQGKITYHQQAAGRSNDSLLLEATNGVTKVGPVRLDIDIVPAILPLKVESRYLKEGKNDMKMQRRVTEDQAVANSSAGLL